MTTTMSESSSDELPVLTSSTMIGGPSEKTERWDNPLRRLHVAITATANHASSPLKVQIHFQVSGRVWQPDFEGVRTGGYSRKENCLAVQVALSEEPPPNADAVLFGYLETSVDLAEEWFVRRKLGTDLRELRGIINAIGSGSPLDSVDVEPRESPRSEPDSTPLAVEQAFPSGTPERFRIVPDDYHVPFAGTAQDGRRFFLSNELFGDRPDSDSTSSFIATFFWSSDGSFDSTDVTELDRPEGVPPAQAVAAGPEAAMNRMILKLGEFTLEPIEVAPFAIEIEGITFGFVPEEIDEDTVSIQIQPGNFIAYYEPWGGEDYDT
jgi:hypothetical protein